jgi:hypothetical protein
VLPRPGNLTANAPVVERVDPQYRPPPGTPDDLVSLRNQIVDTLGARAQAEQFTGMMAKQEAHHAANEKPVADMQKGTAEAIAATEAHKRAIANRDEANARKKEQEDKARGRLEDYGTQAGKLTSLILPLKGLARFTGLASSLPDEPDFVQRFKRGLLKMNSDSRRFLDQLGRMDKAVAEQKVQQTERAQGVQADAATIRKTDGEATKSHETFDAAKQTTEDFGAKNAERKEVAGSQRRDAQQVAAKMDAQARQKEAQASSLAAAMQFWARDHAKARTDALERTSKRLEGMGYKVTEVRER